MEVLIVDHGHYWSPSFRIYIEATAQWYDVRLYEGGVLCGSRIPDPDTPVFNEMPHPTAYDRVDDRVF